MCILYVYLEFYIEKLAGEKINCFFTTCKIKFNNFSMGSVPKVMSTMLYNIKNVSTRRKRKFVEYLNDKISSKIIIAQTYFSFYIES